MRYFRVLHGSEIIYAIIIPHYEEKSIDFLIKIYKPCPARNGRKEKLWQRKKNFKREKKYSLAEKRAYWVGYGHGMSYPSGKSASYKDALSVKEKESYLAGFKKTNVIDPSDSNAFAKKARRNR